MKRIQSIFSLLLIFVAISCGDSEPNNPQETSDNFDRKSLLVDAVDGIIIPAYEDYVEKVKILNSDASIFTQQPDVDNLTKLRVSWLEAYKSWQYVSMFNIGKAEEIALRNFTNIFPTNSIEIEENISTGSYNLELPSKNDEQGFPALDYMIYGIGENDDEIVGKYESESYRTYLTDLTQKLEGMGVLVLEDWKNEYREIFITNDGSSATSSLNKMVNDYLFYYEKYLRAGKIGIPAGVFSGSPLSDRVEAFYAKDVSKQLFLTGLDATQRFFNGRDYNSGLPGTGLKDYLDYLKTIKGGADLSVLINDQFDATRTVAESLNTNFTEQIESDNVKMLETYDALQKNVVYLKVDMLQTLNIKIDFVDADGD